MLVNLCRCCKAIKVVIRLLNTAKILLYLRSLFPHLLHDGLLQYAESRARCDASLHFLIEKEQMVAILEFKHRPWFSTRQCSNNSLVRGLFPIQLVQAQVEGRSLRLTPRFDAVMIFGVSVFVQQSVCQVKLFVHALESEVGPLRDSIYPCIDFILRPKHSFFINLQLIAEVRPRGCCCWRGQIL